MINWLFGWINIPYAEWTVVNCAFPMLIEFIVLGAIVFIVVYTVQEIIADMNYRKTFRNQLRDKNKKAEKEQGKWNR